MTTHPPAPPASHQAALMTGLLEGADQDAYVVAPIMVVNARIERAIQQTLDSQGRARPGKAAAYLVRSLQSNGYIVDTAHTDPRADR